MLEYYVRVCVVSLPHINDMSENGYVAVTMSPDYDFATPVEVITTVSMIPSNEPGYAAVSFRFTLNKNLVTMRCTNPTNGFTASGGPFLFPAVTPLSCRPSGFPDTTTCLKPLCFVSTQNIGRVGSLTVRTNGDIQICSDVNGGGFSGGLGGIVQFIAQWLV
jgi:hypothetical protein